LLASFICSDLLVVYCWFAWREVVFSDVVVIMHPPQLLDSQANNLANFILAYAHTREQKSSPLLGYFEHG
jgi:hypothetical protein